MLKMGKAAEHLSTTERENIARQLFSVKSVKGLNKELI
jgi:hypothetical protein